MSKILKKTNLKLHVASARLLEFAKNIGKSIIYNSSVVKAMGTIPNFLNRQSIDEKIMAKSDTEQMIFKYNEQEKLEKREKKFSKAFGEILPSADVVYNNFDSISSANSRELVKELIETAEQSVILEEASMGGETTNKNLNCNFEMEK